MKGPYVSLRTKTVSDSLLKPTIDNSRQTIDVDNVDTLRLKLAEQLRSRGRTSDNSSDRSWDLTGLRSADKGYLDGGCTAVMSDTRVQQVIPDQLGADGSESDLHSKM